METEGENVSWCIERIDRAIGYIRDSNLAGGGDKIAPTRVARCGGWKIWLRDCSWCASMLVRRGSSVCQTGCRASHVTV